MFRPKPLAKAVSLAVVTGSFGAAPLAYAQDAEVEVDDDEVIDEVITTGSRIRRDGFSSANPVDVVLTENAVVSGISNLGDMMQTTTVAAGAPQVTPATSTAFVQNGGSGVSTLSLRGLGANRTLTLINGRRAGPAGTRGGVSSFDLNVIPLSAVERVEILKDGASSIYGSDAVGGVVNIYTRRDDGASIDAYVMQPTESGGEETRLSATWGKSFDRGFFRLTADYNKLEALAYGDRDYFSCTEQYIFDETYTERRDVVDPRTGKPACRDTLWGHVWLYDYQQFLPGEGNVPTPRRTLAQYDYDGDLGQYIPGIAVDPDMPGFLVAPPNWYLVNYDRQSDAVTNLDHPFQDASSMIPEVEKTTFFANGEFDLTDSMSVYAEALLNRRETQSESYRQYWGYIYNEDSPFFNVNPLSEGWSGAQWLSPTPITDHFGDLTEVDYQRFVAGLKGDITDNWSFDLSYQASKSEGTYNWDIIYADSIYDQNWLYDYGDGTGFSCVGTNTSERGVPCQDIPWLDPAFLAGDVSPEMREFLFGIDVGKTDYEQQSVEGYVSGQLFDLPAGSVGAALGFHWRTEEINDVPGEQTLAGNSWGLSSAGITAGDQETQAVFAEIEVPILSGVPGVEYLSINASTRWTDVDTYGDDTTYKATLDWQVTESFKIRASQGTSFRTPTLFELYLADQTSFIRQGDIDPCIFWEDALDAGDITQRIADNCAADTSAPDYPDGLPPDFSGGTITATAISSGGLGRLEAETSESNTVGLVWQPRSLDFSVSLDYFEIEINDQVDQLGSASIVFGCYASEFYPNDPLCNLFDRSGIGGGIENVQDSYINVSTQTARGWDLAFKYTEELGPGEITFDGQVSRMDERQTALFADTVRNNLGEFGYPEYVARLWTTYYVGDWSAFWGIRYSGSVNSEEDADGPAATYRGETIYRVLKADPVWYHDISVTYNWDDWDMRVILGVSNAFDEEPPQVSNYGSPFSTAGRSPFYSQYDFLGQRWFLNLTKSWE